MNFPIVGGNMKKLILTMEQLRYRMTEKRMLSFRFPLMQIKGKPFILFAK